MPARKTHHYTDRGPGTREGHGQKDNSSKDALLRPIANGKLGSANCKEGKRVFSNLHFAMFTWQFAILHASRGWTSPAPAIRTLQVIPQRFVLVDGRAAGAGWAGRVRRGDRSMPRSRLRPLWRRRLGDDVRRGRAGSPAIRVDV